MKILKQLDNKLANRKEVKFIIESDKNPGFDGALEVISSEFKAEKELIVVKNVKGAFGRDTFLIDGIIYKSVKDREDYEVKPKAKKAGGAQ